MCETDKHRDKKERSPETMDEGWGITAQSEIMASSGNRSNDYRTF